MIEESRFADLIVLDAETSFTRTNEAIPGRFVKDVLLESECPVIISPYSFDRIEEVVFSYNGSTSSVFAIKQFTYLFPELRQKKAIVVCVRDDGGETLAEQFKMKEWLKDHYSDVEYVVLKGDPSDQLFGYLIEKKNGIVVMGAYGRSMLSRLFKPSHARLIVKTINLPIFISHF
jgi:nucleotide-binding universal stress UspA family protein